MTAEKFSDEEFREKLSRNIQEFTRSPVEQEVWDWFLPKIYYHTGDFRDQSLYKQLKEKLAAVDRQQGLAGNYLFYLATAPQFFGEIIRQLGAAGLTRENNGVWRRAIIEKPFGRDLESARALNKEITSVLDESQIYRIDHYLGKETVQNMMVFRFGNGIFELIWNRCYIDHVQITVGETVGVEQRGGYYDTAGALRDMIPNHTLQLVAMTAMEPPISFHSEAVRDEKAKVLHAIQPLNPEDVLTKAVRGQYGLGTIDEKPVPGYRTAPRVNPQSTTETFVAMEVHIDNWRWAGVPFYVRTEKRLAERLTEIAIQFKCAPQLLFRGTEVRNLSANQLVMHIQLDDAWNALPPRDFPNCAAGSWGPKDADHLLEREGRQWRVRL